MRKVLDIVIRHADHEGDGLGPLFLDGVDDRGLRHRLGQYLGKKIRISHARLKGSQLHVRVECADFETESDHLVDLALRHADSGRPRAAFGQLEEAVRLFPLNAVALKRLGHACYGRAEYTRAMALFLHATEVLGEDAEALRALGTICLRGGDLRKALAYFKRAILAQPNDDAAAAALRLLSRHVSSKPKLAVLRVSSRTGARR